MVARRFIVRHNADEFSLDYDTGHGLDVLKFQIFSLTSVPPDDQKILSQDKGFVVTEETDLNSLSEKLQLVSIGVEDEEEEAKKSILAELERSDEELARLLQAEEEALLHQQYSVVDNGEEFRRRIRPHVDQVLMYEDLVRQEAARKSVPVDEVREKALISLAKEGNFKPSTDEEDHAFLLQLLFWFKSSFRWVNSPPCDNCDGGTSNIGMGSALPSEIKFGASRVEIYRCNSCANVTRFPRYNDPLKLVETRRGRCGEWANCFTLYCRAFGYESRLILDLTDHVWTECYSRLLGRWMHLDPCEGVYNKPLLYEKGWNKKLNYVIAIAKDGVHDVTKRYTRKWHEVLTRRNITTEANASLVLSALTNECRTGYPPEALQMLELRDRNEAEELEREIHQRVDASLSLPGRQSGAVEWRKARSELGSSIDDSFGSSSCPLRKCFDGHVTKIYGASALLYSQYSEDELSKHEIIQILEKIRTLVLDIRAAPFRNRVSFLDPSMSRFSEKTLHQIEALLSAISLKCEWDNNARVSLAGDPVETSVALPVVLDVLNEIIENVKSNELSSKLLVLPRTDRLSYGSVIATGEELPFGIATSAFDGNQSTKWEEPNGAKGCWLIYSVADEGMYDLVSYDLMSTNDAPERDPMDWVIEGSKDGGANWIVLDKQSSQIFERRFQRKNFVVHERCMCNAFRFRILAVRDQNATSRFQIGSIDLYAKADEPS